MNRSASPANTRSAIPPANAEESDGPPKTYAFISHESAVEAIWALAARRWENVLEDENIWLAPEAKMCVTTQGDFKRLAKDVKLLSLGIRTMPVHLLVPNKSCYSRGKRAVFHVWSDFFPEHSSFVRVHDRVFVSTPYFAVFQLAMACRAGRQQLQAAEESASEDSQVHAMLGTSDATPTASEILRWENIARFVRATQVLTDFMGTYRYHPGGEDGATSILYGMKPIIAPEAFAGFLAKMDSCRGIARGRDVAAAAFAGSASPMETMLALMLCLPQDMGGFGLPRPVINQPIYTGSTGYNVTSQEIIIPDLSWPERKLAVEYYGWNEHYGAGSRKVADDAARANSLTALGWSVLHVTFNQVKTLMGISLLARQIAYLLQVELGAPSSLEQIWRTRLLAQLLPDEASRGSVA